MKIDHAPSPAIPSFSSNEFQTAAKLIMAGITVTSEVDSAVEAFAQPIRTERKGVDNAIMTYAHKILGTGGTQSLAAEDLGDVDEFLATLPDEGDENAQAAWEQLGNLMQTMTQVRAVRVAKDSNGDGQIDLTARKVAYVIAALAPNGSEVVGVSFVADES